MPPNCRSSLHFDKGLDRSVDADFVLESLTSYPRKPSPVDRYACATSVNGGESSNNNNNNNHTNSTMNNNHNKGETPATVSSSPLGHHKTDIVHKKNGRRNASRVSFSTSAAAAAAADAAPLLDNDGVTNGVYTSATFPPGDLADVVQELSCCHVVLEEEHVVQLDHVLSTRTDQYQLQSLKMCGNGLSDSSMHALANILHSQQALRTLDLSENDIRASGLEWLVNAALESMACPLHELNLNHNHLGTKAAASSINMLLRRHQTLRSLHLAHNKMGPKSMEKIAKALRGNAVLQELDLSYNHLGSHGATLIAAVLDPEASVCPLQVLNMSMNRIGHDGCAELMGALMQRTRNNTLRQLDLSMNQIGEEGAELVAAVLQFSHTITHLNLSRNDIKSGIQRIASALIHNSQGTALQHLDVSWNSITDRDIIAEGSVADMLRGNSVLETLNLASNAVSNVGVTALMRALHADLALQELNLVGNQLRDPAPVVHFLCHAASSSSKLERLLLDRNNLSEESERWIQHAYQFRRNKQTWLRLVLKHVKCDKWIKLDLDATIESWNRKQQRKAGSRGNDLPSEQADYLRYGDMELTAVAQLCAKYRPTLIHARLQQQPTDSVNHMTELGIATFIQNIMLQNPDDYHDEDVDDDDMSYATTTTIATHVTHNTMNSTFRRSSQQHARNVPPIDKRRGGVRRLDISDIILDHGKAVRVLSFALQQEEHHTPCTTPHTSPRDSSWGILQSLSLVRCSLSPSLIDILVEGLRHNRNVARLDLTGNGFGDEGMHSLWTLVLSGLFEEEDDDDHKVVGHDNHGRAIGGSQVKPVKVSESMRRSCLTSLNVSKNDITDRGMFLPPDKFPLKPSYLCPVVRSTLEELRLANNQLTDWGALQLAQYLVIPEQATRMRQSHLQGGPHMSRSATSITHLRWVDVTGNMDLTSRGYGALKLFLPPSIHVLEWDKQEQDALSV